MPLRGPCIIPKNGADCNGDATGHVNGRHGTNGKAADPWDPWGEEADADLLAVVRAVKNVGEAPERPSPEWLATEGPRVEALLDNILPHVFGGDPAMRFSNFAERRVRAKGEDKAKVVRVPGTAAKVYRALRWAMGGNWPKQTGGLLFALEGDRPLWLEDADQLFAWVAGKLRKPVRWAEGLGMVNRSVFFAYLRQNAERYEAVEPLPHEPQVAGHYYLPAEVAGGDGKALAGLLDRFNPATPVDRDLILAAFLTPFWGGPGGARPVILVESPPDDPEKGRGVGKTTLALAIAHVAGGHLDFRPGDDFGRLVSRLLTPNALGKRVALLDNVKALRFSWADLEGLVTADQVSGHRLFAGEASRPNLLTWFVTLNGANLSKDLAQRSVIVRVRRPDYDAGWRDATWRYLDQHRAAIVGDLLALLRSPQPLPGEVSRWGAWEAGVLACVGDPAACLKELAARRATVDADQEDADLVREAFVTELRNRGQDPDTEVVFIPSADAAKIVNEATDEKRSVPRACAYLGTLAIPELKRGNAHGGHRGWRWTGPESKPGQAAVPLGLTPAGRLAEQLKARGGKFPTPGGNGRVTVR